MNSHTAFDVSGVLREALWLPWKNAKLTLSVTLLVILPFSLLVLLHSLILGPSLEEIEDEEFSVEHHNILVLIVAELIFQVLFAFLFLFAMTATIYYSSAIYNGENVTFHGMLQRISAKWTGPASTFLCCLLIAVAYISGVTLLIGAFALVLGDNTLAHVWIGLMGVPGTLFFIYLAAIGLFSVVVSIVEDDWYGTRAIARAGELLTARKLQMFVLMLMFVLLGAPIYAIFLVNMVDDELSAVIHVIVGTITTTSVCLVNLFTFVVFTVFYWKSKMNPGPVHLPVRVDFEGPDAQYGHLGLVDINTKV